MSGREEKSPPPLLLVGMGDDGLDGLPLSATRALFAADVIITSRRLISLLPPELARKAQGWPSPFSAMADHIARLREKGGKVAVIATGDPFWHGVGSVLARHFPPEEMTVHGHPSAFSLACARLGWPLQDTRQLSLHGARSSALIERYLHPGERLLVLPRGRATPLVVAERLSSRGFGPSKMTILAHMNGRDEQRFTTSALQLADSGRTDFPDFHVIAVECIADEDTPIYPLSAGLPDDAFTHDGQITKRHVRAITVSALMPRPRATLWDVGAGCGSVAVEWLRLSGPTARAIAIEKDEERCRMIAANADRLGAPEIEIVHGAAPAALSGLDAPDALFIGAAADDDELFDACWSALGPGGLLVANAVTAGGEAALQRRHRQLGGELTRIAISRCAPLGDKQAMRPALPVTQLVVVKPIAEQVKE